MQKLRLFVAACMLLSCHLASAQRSDSTLAAKKNVIKVNLSALIFKNYSFQYERVVGRKMSVALGVARMPKSELPFANEIRDEYADDVDVQRAVDQTRLSNFSITPEVRFYLGRKAAPAGFYVAPFLRYTHSTFDGVYTFTPSGDPVLHTANLSGTINNIGGGLLLGSQWNLSKRLTLDLWIAGPIIGSTKGKLAGYDPRPIPPQDRQSIKQDIDDFDPLGLDFTGTVGANQVDVDIKGTYYGLRGLGLCFGFKF